MNKTISINISGLNFIIEEDAYYKLQNYLDEIKKHCGDNADVEEVISDIESGISEKLKSLITPYKEVITMKDIDSLIKIMGTTEDFEREVGWTHKEDSSNPDSKNKRKLYRDPDDVVIAGVASGLGAYFDIDPVIFRVIFFLLIFASGFGILAYIVLWIAMPEAKTANQKLEMRGEAPTVAAFEKLSKMEKKLKKNWKERWSKYSIVKKIISLPVLILSSVFDALKKVFSKIGPIFRFLFGLFLIVMSLLGLGVVGVGSLYLLLQSNSAYSFAFVPVSELIHIVPFFWLIITGFLSLSIPAMFFLIGGLNLLRKKNFFTFNMGVILISVWMIAGISFCSLSLRYFPDVVSKINNYPAIQTITKPIDILDTNKIIVNGSNIKVSISSDKDTGTTITGRAVDVENVEIKKDNNNLFITWIDQNNSLCFNCYNNPVELVTSKDNFSKIKVENGAIVYTQKSVKK
jgi:phage shock protein PspC (stress-responsive transcriptional regulator)